MCQCANDNMLKKERKTKQICNEKVFVICNQINNLKKENGWNKLWCVS